MIRVKVLGGRSLAKKLRDLKKQQQKAVGQAVSASLEQIRNEARLTLARGPSPKSRSGRLADSLFVRLDPDGLGGSIGTGLAYGRHLEFGTSKMPAHPWLLPTFERLKPEIRARIAKAVKEANRKAARGGGTPGASSGAGQEV